MALSVNLYKDFGSFVLDVTLEHESGILGILGGSGMGKSLTLMMIAGLITPDKGRVVIGGRTVYDSEKKIDVPARERKVGYLFQNYALFPNMTVAENIAIVLKCKGIEKQEKLSGLIRQFALTGLENRKPRSLSGGQQQRVALARIMASEPELLLLDEPFSALDSYLKEQLIQEMSSQLKAYQKDVILVSHNRDEIYQMTQNLAIIDEGKIKAFGPTKQVFSSPGCVAGARLTGCKNIVAFERMADGKIFVPDWQCALDPGMTVPEDACALGIRAHYMDVYITPPKDMAHVLSVTVDSVSELPFEWYVLFTTKGSGKIWWKMAKGARPGIGESPVPEAGSTVYVYLPPESMIWLR